MYTKKKGHMALQASSYGEEDIDPEGSDAVMSDKVTYTFDELVDQVQVPPLLSMPHQTAVFHCNIEYLDVSVQADTERTQA